MAQIPQRAAQKKHIAIIDKIVTGLCPAQKRGELQRHVSQGSRWRQGKRLKQACLNIRQEIQDGLIGAAGALELAQLSGELGDIATVLAGETNAEKGNDLVSIREQLARVQSHEFMPKPVAVTASDELLRSGKSSRPGRS